MGSDGSSPMQHRLGQPIKRHSQPGNMSPRKSPLSMSAVWVQGVEPSGFNPQRYFAENRWARNAAVGAGAFFAITLAVTLARVAKRYNSPTSKRRRTVDMNKAGLLIAAAANAAVL